MVSLHSRDVTRQFLEGEMRSTVVGVVAKASSMMRRRPWLETAVSSSSACRRLDDDPRVDDSLGRRRNGQRLRGLGQRVVRTVRRSRQRLPLNSGRPVDPVRPREESCRASPQPSVTTSNATSPKPTS